MVPVHGLHLPDVRARLLLCSWNPELLCKKPCLATVQSACRDTVASARGMRGSEAPATSAIPPSSAGLPTEHDHRRAPWLDPWSSARNPESRTPSTPVVFTTQG